MKVLIFDLDDTLLMSNTYKRYRDIRPSYHLNYLLYKYPNKKFIYTNGTYGHGEDGLNAMKCKDSFQKIYGRDTLPYMKPDFKSFNYVNNDILYNHNLSDKKIFFDDLQENLKTAHNIGWETVWIHPQSNNNMKPYYIDHAYTNVIDALYSIDLN
tara:strand:+ start:2539 stop:3003 length:465 start_codon:yes stop_codon:yes gene_type:complete